MDDGTRRAPSPNCLGPRSRVEVDPLTAIGDGVVCPIGRWPRSSPA